MPVTLKDIALKSGFSITTVSRALAGYDDVSEKTRAHIYAIANELGYQPNQVARQLQGQSTNTVGIITPMRQDYQDDDFFSVLLKGITFAASQHNFDVLMSVAIPGTTELEAYRRFAGGKRVDGMILARTYRNDPRINYLKSIDFPFVVGGRAAPHEQSDFPYIDYDSQFGIATLVTHFIGYGHQHIGIVLPSEELAFADYRFQGYRKALQQAGIAFNSSYTERSDLTYEGGQNATQKLLDRHPEITAIVGCNDLMALGAMSAIQHRNLQVGEDIAVGGFDNIPAAERSTPPLTTISQPIYELGQKLTNMLIQIIDDAPVPNIQRLITPGLIVRESSGKPRD
jgi:LacI family transcriptional regulator